MNTVIAAFLLGFSALFSIVNPVSSAFIFRTRTIERSHVDRVRLARRVGVYAALVMLVALWAGSYVLAFFGISLPALRCAGGVVLAMYAWSSLNAPERREARKAEQAAAAAGQDDPAFYPLTLPFTAEPGTISVAVALGSAHPAESVALVPFFIGMSAAAMLVAVLVWLFYSASDQISRSRYAERQGKSPRELMTSQGHPQWLTLLGLGPLQPQRADPGRLAASRTRHLLPISDPQRPAVSARLV